MSYLIFQDVQVESKSESNFLIFLFIHSGQYRVGRFPYVKSSNDIESIMLHLNSIYFGRTGNALYSSLVLQGRGSIFASAAS